MTGDKDDPRFDEFYLTGNEARLFTALSSPICPVIWRSVSNAGTLTPPRRPTSTIPSSTSSASAVARRRPEVYVFGKTPGFTTGYQPASAAEQILPQIVSADTHWLLPPDATAATRVIAWTQSPHHGSFCRQSGWKEAAVNIKIPRLQDRENCRRPSIFQRTRGRRATLGFLQ